MKPVVLFALVCLSALLINDVIAQKKLDKLLEKPDTVEDDLEDDDDDDEDDGEDPETAERLPHERNQGPLFERQPLDVTVVLDRNGPPDFLQCSASQTFSIRVKCSSQDPSQSGHAGDLDVFPLTARTISDFVHPYSGIRQMEIQAEIGDTVLHRFHIDRKNHNVTLYCACQALSSKGHSTSRVATVKFTTDPSRAEKPQQRTISFGEKVLLECPVGQVVKKSPKGTETLTFWHLNGAPLLFDDNVNPEGDDLLILRAKVENEGNYTCGIKTIAANGKEQVRLGETVSILVRANGSWSPWGAWSECSSKCGRGHRSRTRSCTNPPPRNGGKDCYGNYIEKSECVSSRRDCAASKEKGIEDTADIWTPWSAWSECGPNCRRHRQRRCTFAVGRPSRKSALCEEKEDHMSEPCTGGECRLGLTFPPPPPMHGMDNNNIHEHPAGGHEQGFIVSNLGSVQAVAMVIGMALAAIILAFTFIIAIRFWPRDEAIHNKRQPHHPYASVPVNALAALPADVMSLDSRHQEYLVERKMDPAVTIPLLQQLYTPNICAASLTPMQMRATFTQRSHTPSSTSKTTRSESGSQHSGGLCGQEYDLIYDTIPDEGSENVSISQKSAFTASAVIGPEGGRISLDHLGVSLTLPPGAVSLNKKKIFVSVLNSSRDLPNWLKDKFSVLSAVVECGPPDVVLARPAILTFDHCACEPAKWNVHLMSCVQGSNRNYSSWKKKLSLEAPESSTDILCHVDENVCHIQTDHLASFVLCGESKLNTFATKSSTVLAFLSKRRGVNQRERTLKVHCVEDTKASVQTVLALHEENYTLVESPKTMQLHDGGANLCVALDEETLPPGWETESCGSLQEIPFRKVWSTLQSAHCSFTLTCPNTTSFSAHDVPLECRITVYQRGNQSHRQVLNLNSSTAWPIYRNFFETVATPKSAVKKVDGFRLSKDCRKKLSDLLDPVRDDGRDWRKLAQHLGMNNRNLIYFAQKASPTSHLLDLWEASRRGVEAPTNLLLLVRSLGRPEVISAAEDLLGAWV
ncbi:netrin receptor UNC5C [Galendromus occidentalis]|uniref:Netrin receptor UNC5 n=1 Tax=Galendromus occidentalis TaxID=34638 RepID=A0AAJ7L5F7_9ACAR|nr:netrin receptor UNC5C [Galendromus occidentalis]